MVALRVSPLPIWRLTLGSALISFGAAMLVRVVHRRLAPPIPSPQTAPPPELAEDSPDDEPIILVGASMFLLFLPVAITSIMLAVTLFQEPVWPIASMWAATICWGCSMCLLAVNSNGTRSPHWLIYGVAMANCLVGAWFYIGVYVFGQLK